MNHELLISISGNKDIHYSNYSAYAVYDQASVGIELDSSILDQLNYRFETLSNPEQMGIVLAAIIAILCIAGIIMQKFFKELKEIYTEARRRLKR